MTVQVRLPIIYWYDVVQPRANTMEVALSTPHDIARIFEPYEAATDFQKTKFSVHRPAFERSMVAAEIAEGRQYKLLENEQVAAV